MNNPFSTITNLIYMVVGWFTPSWPLRIALNILGLSSGIFHYFEFTGSKWEWIFQKADIISIYLLFLLMITGQLDISDWYALIATAIIGWLHVTQGWFDSFKTIPVLFLVNTVLSIIHGKSLWYIPFFLIALLFGQTANNNNYDIRHGLWHVFSGLGFYFWLAF